MAVSHTIATLLKGARGTPYFQQALDSEVLLAHVLQTGREHLVAHPEQAVSQHIAQRFQAFLAQRKDGVPVAYLTNEKEFYGLPFFVDERVLIPRPETETLIDVTRTVLKTLPPAASLCDVGTGSGCIAITLAHHHLDLRVTAIDISPDALTVAKKNAKRHGVLERISFAQSDLLEAVFDQAFDVIVANLPYIGTVHEQEVEPSVKAYEPPEAVFAGESGVEAYERLFAQVQHLSKKPRYIVGEFFAPIGDGLRMLFCRYFSGLPIAIIQDAAGLERVFLMQL